MYKIVNRNLYLNGRIINDGACEVIKETVLKICDYDETRLKHAFEIDKLKDQLRGIEQQICEYEQKNADIVQKVNECNKFICELKSIGFCAVDEKGQMRDIVTGNIIKEWADHKYYCRNRKPDTEAYNEFKKEGKKHGLVKQYI